MSEIKLGGSGNVWSSATSAKVTTESAAAPAELVVGRRSSTSAAVLAVLK